MNFLISFIYFNGKQISDNYPDKMPVRLKQSYADLFNSVINQFQSIVNKITDI
jgi:hypothetical protein